VPVKLGSGLGFVGFGYFVLFYFLEEFLGVFWDFPVFIAYLG
jgi:hypothetical protein